MRASRRLFVGLPLPIDVAGAIERATRSSGVAEPEFRVLPAADLHVTLRFLGSTGAEAAEAVIAGLRERLARFGPIDLELAPAGTFPGRGRARVLWIGVREPDADAHPSGADAGRSGADAGRLAQAFRAVEAASVAAGFEPDPRLAAGAPTPHVTVARPRSERGARAPEAFRDCAPRAAWPADEIVLFESLAGRAPGARYLPLAPR